MRLTGALPRTGPSGVGGELVAAGDAIHAVQAGRGGLVVPAGGPDKQGRERKDGQRGETFRPWGHAGQSTASFRGRNTNAG